MEMTQNVADFTDKYQIFSCIVSRKDTGYDLPQNVIKLTLLHEMITDRQSPEDRFPAARERHWPHGDGQY